MVDIACVEGRDPVADIKLINRELERYSPELASRPQIIVANKADILDRDVVDVDGFEAYVRENGWDLCYVSAATGEGIPEMVRLTAQRLSELPPVTVYESEMPEEDLLPEEKKRETVIRRENDTFYVEGEWLYDLMGRVNFGDYESLNYFQRVLRNAGVFDALEEKGCRDGHTVTIYDFSFEYVK